MRVNYKGMDRDYNYRVAEISWDDENQKEENAIHRIAYLMEVLGWNIEIVTNGYALCEVDDKEAYTEFMRDWKDCKKSIKTNQKEV